MRIWGWLRETYKDHALATLFSQTAFDRFAARHSWLVHVWGLVFGSMLVLCLGAGVKLGLEHRTHQELMRHGADASAVITDIKVDPYKSGRANRQWYAVSVVYQFTAWDLRRYEGRGAFNTAERPTWRKGSRIAVIYDTRDATRSGWRVALEHRHGAALEYIAVMPFMILYLLLCMYRYGRWWRNSTDFSAVPPPAGSPATA